MERKLTVSLEKLLQAVALGNTETDVISSIAGRLARMDKKLNPEDKAEVQKLSGGKSLKALTGDLVQALDPDMHVEQAKKDNPGIAEPLSEHVKQAATKIIKESVKPLHNAELRKKLVELHKTTEQIIDTISPDEVIEAGFKC
jgi:type I restriction enzyme R subunit